MLDRVGEWHESRERWELILQGLSKPRLIGHDLQIEAGLGVVVGYAAVACCDEKNCLHRVELIKKCAGMYAGASIGMEILCNVNGKNCPKGYEGFFAEYGAGLMVQVTFEIGLDETTLLPKDDPVLGVGISVGVTPILTQKICEYKILHDDVVGPCEDWP